MAVYVGSVVALQYAFRALTSENSRRAIVASALLIAALVDPLRHRLQASVDLSFCRKKYDAARVPGAFSERPCDEIDLDKPSEVLIFVMRDTIRPLRVSLRVRDLAPDRRPRADYRQRQKFTGILCETRSRNAFRNALETAAT